MVRKKPPGNLDQVQGNLVAAVDHVVSGIEAQLVDHAEARLIEFVLGGGLADQLAARMLPHLEAFKNQVSAIPSPGTLALGAGAIDTEVDDV